MATDTQDPTGLLMFGHDDPNHPLNHTKAKRAYLKRTLPPGKFKLLTRLSYIDDMPPILNDDDMPPLHEEGLNEIIISLFGVGKNDGNNEHMVDSNDDSKSNYHQCNVDDRNLKDSMKRKTKTTMFKLGESRTSKFRCTLILLEIKSPFGWLDKRFTTLMK